VTLNEPHDPFAKRLFNAVDLGAQIEDAEPTDIVLNE